MIKTKNLCFFSVILILSLSTPYRLCADTYCSSEGPGWDYCDCGDPPPPPVLVEALVEGVDGQNIKVIERDCGCHTEIDTVIIRVRKIDIPPYVALPWAHIWFEFDETLFYVRDLSGPIASGECLSWVGNVFLITLSVDNVDDIDLNSKVKLYGERGYGISFGGFDEDCPCDYIRKKYFGQIYGVLKTVGITLVKEPCDDESDDGSCTDGSCQPFLLVSPDRSMPSGGAPIPADGDSGRLSYLEGRNGSGQMGLMLSVENFSTEGRSLKNSQERLLRLYGSIYNPSPIDSSIYDKPEANINGFWFKPAYRSYWSNSSVSYQVDQGSVTRCTKVSFYIYDTKNKNTYYYAKTGSWTGEDITEAKKVARGAVRGKVPLQHITHNGLTVQYNYDGTNNRATITDPIGLQTRYTIYKGVNPDDSSSTVSRIWIGTNLGDYSDTGDCSGGRWVDLQIDSGTDMLTKVSSSCSSCGAYEYEYVPAYTNPILPNNDDAENIYECIVFNPEDPYTFEPSHYLVSKVKDDNENVLASYDYDSKDRITSSWLGEKGSGARVRNLVFTTYENGESQGASGVLEEDYVSNTQYRASIAFYNTKGQIIEKRQYHNLQSGHFLKGFYSRTLCEYVEDGSGNLITKNIILPRGNKICEIYDSSKGHQVTKRLKINNKGDAIEEAKYTYTGETQGQYLVSTFMDARSATTNYYYDTNANLITQIAPEPASGMARVTTIYKYDNLQRVTKDIVQGTSDVTTEYHYDNKGNLLTRIVSSANKSLTTLYQYNIYSEQTKMTDAKGYVKETVYNTQGRVEAEVTYEDTNCDKIVNATSYEYGNLGRLTKKGLTNLREPYQDSDYSNIPSNKWVYEAYFYDTYGRLTALVADEGTGRNNLTTSYEYNNLSEVTKVTEPDDQITIKERDGRGLVVKEIKKRGTISSTAQYFYDENGNLTKKKDPEGVCEIYEYDGFDRKVRTKRIAE